MRFVEISANLLDDDADVASYASDGYRGCNRDGAESSRFVVGVLADLNAPFQNPRQGQESCNLLRSVQVFKACVDLFFSKLNHAEPLPVHTVSAVLQVFKHPCFCFLLVPLAHVREVDACNDIHATLRVLLRSNLVLDVRDFRVFHVLKAVLNAAVFLSTVQHLLHLRLLAVGFHLAARALRRVDLHRRVNAALLPILPFASGFKRLTKALFCVLEHVVLPKRRLARALCLPSGKE